MMMMITVITVIVIVTATTTTTTTITAKINLTKLVNPREAAEITKEEEEEITGLTRLGKRSATQAGIKPRPATRKADALPQGQRGGVQE